METDEMIRIELICSSYNVESSFIDSLENAGLIQVNVIQDMRYLPVESISDLERMIRLHYDLEINLEGIETIIHLLNRISTLHQHLNEIENRLRFYEGQLSSFE
jgi:hypothetical protein